MKQQLLTGTLVLVLVTLFSLPAFTEVSLSGNTQITTVILPTAQYTADRFESLLNPGNIMGLHDISLKFDFTAKVSAETDNGAFDFWFKVEPIGLPGLLVSLFSGSSADPGQLMALTETLKSANYNLSGLTVQRAAIKWFVTDSVTLSAGRQDLFTGYGYGWNPINLAGITQKNPFDPGAELSGTDSVSLSLNIGNLFTLNASGIYSPNDFETGVDYNDLKGFAALTASLPKIEITIDGLYDFSKEEDSRVPAAGAGFMADIWGIGIYGEAALLKGSKIQYPDTAGNLISKKSIQFNGLAGFEYTFPWDMDGIFEYFYNGEGFNISDRENYYNLIKLYGSSYVPFDVVSLMKPGYFAQDYCLLYLMQPVYSINAETSISLIYSPDSYSLTVMPLFSYNISGSLTMQAGYTGLFSLKKNQYNETDLSPIKYAVTLKAEYSF